MPSPQETTVNAQEQNKEEQTNREEPLPIQDLPPREISQTDHINKKLLTSLFNRMDEGGDSLLSKMLEDDNKEVEDAEWDD